MVWCHVQAGRFIPAGAGNTNLAVVKNLAKSVYPRWRGEHGIKSTRFESAGGLSPLARGTPPARPTDSLAIRFIPAGAGNTLPFSVSLRRLAVYPRWRGEHLRVSLTSARNFGLSPLARGTRAGIVVHEIRDRFIPAGAGNTPTGIPVTDEISVYPRWRGEHKATKAPCWSAFGLSPLARGTPAAAFSDRMPPRFIPAGAGNTLKLPN